MTKLRHVGEALRAYQWSKNLLVFAGLIFAQGFLDPDLLAQSIIAFFSFCFASSSVYIFNDLIDLKEDKLHPKKRLRPFASGQLSPASGIILILFLVTTSVIGSVLVNSALVAVIITYLLLNIFYSTILKNVVLIDVMVIALGFVLRAIGGALAVNVIFSNWLVLCTLFLALFLALGKRRSEMIALGDEAAGHRSVLANYSIGLLDSLILIMAVSTLVVYVIYTCSPEVAERIGSNKLYLTVPFVIYGLFRYVLIVYHTAGGSDPSRALLKDYPLLITVLAWGTTTIALIYVVPKLTISF